ncbi:transposase, partial [Shigella sonnei]|nr:transposase [Shigella sonnei]
DRNRSHWSTSKTPSYTKSVSWQHHPRPDGAGRANGLLIK